MDAETKKEIDLLNQKIDHLQATMEWMIKGMYLAGTIKGNRLYWDEQPKSPTPPK